MTDQDGDKFDDYPSDESQDSFDHDEMAELSLDDLGAAYARAAAEHDPEAFATSIDGDSNDDEPAHENADTIESSDESLDEQSVTPEMIVEGALFVGHPEGKPISEQRLASLMRDVTPEEVASIINHLNESYRQNDQALRIVGDDNGYRMTVSPAVENVRRSFMGKVREAKLSQTAVEVLALVAYQPGVTLQKIQDQRGRESASLLNQLVRRQLLRMERVKAEGSRRSESHYYPTERFLYLFGLDSLDDLPQVEEGLREA